MPEPIQNADTLFGTDLNDTIALDAGNDLYDGGAGDDLILGEGGHDRLLGGSGNDVLEGGIGHDTLDGQAGNDTVRGGTGHDFVNGGAGDDLVEGGGGLDTLVAGMGNDTLTGGDHADIFRILANAGTGSIITDFTSGEDVIDATRIGTVSLADTASGLRLSSDTGVSILLQGVTLADIGEGDILGVLSPHSGDGIGQETLDGDNSLSGSSADDSLQGGDGNDTLEGEDGNDTLDGGNHNDLITGGAGDDLLRGEGGHDRLLGGPGNDVLEGGIGHDTLDGQAGNDTVRGGTGHDFVNGGAGDDLVEGGGGLDTLVAGMGNDTLTGGDHADIFRILANAGTGSIITDFTSGEDVIDATRIGTVSLADTASGLRLSSDTGVSILLQGVTLADIGEGDILGVLSPHSGDGIGQETLDGDNSLSGSSADDSLQGGDGNDTLEGEDGNDTLDGGNHNDLITGGAGDDLLRGEGGHDRLLGGPGNDVLEGGIGHDTLDGQAGNDTVRGGTGHDFVNGGAGDDLVEGGGGLDTLVAGMGNDTLTGGDHADIFRIQANAGTLNTITDFTPGEDILDCSRLQEIVLIQYPLGVVIWSFGSPSVSVLLEGVLLSEIDRDRDIIGQTLPELGDELRIGDTGETLSYDVVEGVGLSFQIDLTAFAGTDVTLVSAEVSTGGVTFQADTAPGGDVLHRYIVSYDSSTGFEDLDAGETAIETLTLTFQYGGSETISQDVSLTVQGLTSDTGSGEPEEPLVIEVTEGTQTLINPALFLGVIDPGIVSYPLTTTFGASLTLQGNGQLLLDTSGLDILAHGTLYADSFSYSYTDGSGTPQTVSVDVALTGANDAPTLADSSLSVTEDSGAVSLDLASLADDLDVDDDPSTLTYSITGTPTGGQASLSGSVLTFDTLGDFADLNAGQSASDSIIVTVTDRHGGTASAEISVSVAGADDPLVALLAADAFDFGATATSTMPESTSVRLINTGSTAITLGAELGLDSPFQMVDRSYLWEHVYTGDTVAAGASVWIDLQFAPSQSGSYSDVLTLAYSDALEDYAFTFDLAGMML